MDNTIKGGGNGASELEGQLSFEERLGAEPRETAAAWRAENGGDVDAEQLASVEAAEALERRIEGTLRGPQAPADLIDDLMALPAQASRRRGPPAWLAIAASLVLMVGVSGVVWLGVQPGDATVADYVEAHFHHDGEAVLARAGEGADPSQVQAVLASLGATASEDLTGRIQYIKFCPTPDSKGAHMVVSTADGPATVIFMPAVTVDEPLFLSFDGVDAKVVGLDSGAAAIIGTGEAAARELRASLEAGIKPMGTDL